MPLGVGFLLDFIGPGGGGFELFLPGVGIRLSKKLPGDFAQGDGQAWK